MLVGFRLTKKVGLCRVLLSIEISLLVCLLERDLEHFRSDLMIKTQAQISAIESYALILACIAPISLVAWWICAIVPQQGYI